jgi:hypothetical protein
MRIFFRKLTVALMMPWFWVFGLIRFREMRGTYRGLTRGLEEIA